MIKEGIFILDNTNHFDRTNFLHENPGISPNESYGSDGHHIFQSYQITKVILLKESIGGGLVVLDQTLANGDVRHLLPKIVKLALQQFH